jgi:hypothetical protein
MMNKDSDWRKSWSRDDDGNLVHASGLRVLVRAGDGFTDLEADDASLVIFQAREASKGVATHLLVEKIKKLMKEAELWHLSSAN